MKTKQLVFTVMDEDDIKCKSTIEINTIEINVKSHLIWNGRIRYQ